MRRLALVLSLAASGLLACSGKPAEIVRGEGLDVRTLPVELRSDYEVFATRCSKCHALSRALNSGIVEDEFWVRYVDRMRLQPASGISPADTAPILRFLHHYSIEQKRLKAGGQGGLAGRPKAASLPSPRQGL